MAEVSTNLDIQIRSYQPEDEDAVKDIFLRTAYLGGPSINFINDGVWLHEAMVSYYTRFEPKLCFVAVNGPEVVGYIMGAQDTSAYQRTWLKRIFPKLILQFFTRGIFIQGRAWTFLLQVLRSLVRAEFDYPPNFLKLFPAHLHINVKPSHQDHGVGKFLLAVMLEKLRSLGLKGVHARASRRNDSHPFFEKAGFTFICKQEFTLWDYLEPQPVYLLTYGLPIANEGAPKEETHA